MTNPLQLIRNLDTPTPRDSEALLRSADRTQPLKSRRQRRQEQRDSKALRRSTDRLKPTKSSKKMVELSA